ncbi:MAG: Nif3-like dinuclear metal center hexameric protein [Phycisphaerales bacterium]|nr:Nif3-like dinuclear metal center hexameric protein [Planctomycetota bacterium]MCH8507948.1 Nif3-like dinuclear metal center hexameric protein [Phycisphaerales bacterium]
MVVQDLIDAMEQIAPLRAAEPWDRVGLQLGVPSRPIGGPVLLTIDLTEAVLEEAVRLHSDAVIAYHPVIWNPLTTLTDATHTERIVRGAAEAGIAIFVPHTALDATPGGVADWLCEGISAPLGEAKEGVIQGDCRGLAPATGGETDREVKVITFVPSDKVDMLRSALGTAGAGGIGKYRLCSFTVEGEGTFLPMDGADPAVGEVGRLERVRERRLEMVCSKRSLPLVIETLKQFHPYEEPAFDIVELLPEPIRRAGSGRRVVLDQPASVGELGDRLKAHLGRARIRYALAGDDRPFRTVAVVPGSGGDFVQMALSEGCEVLVTGEMTHHEMLAARQSGLSILLAGHTNTERGYLKRLAVQLGDILGPDADIRVSAMDQDWIVAV